MVAVVVSKDFPEPQLVVETLKRGIEYDPRIIFLARERDEGAAAAFAELGIEWLPIPLNPWFGKKSKHHADHRTNVRNSEMCTNVTQVLLFHKAGSGTTKWFVDRAKFDKKVKVIERGKATRKRKGRAKNPHV